MAIYFDNAPVTSIKFNGQLLDEFTFNGVQVLSAPTGFDFVYEFDGSAETSVEGDRYLTNVGVGDNPALYYWNKAVQTINDHPFVGYGAVLPVSTEVVPDAIYVDAVNGNDDTGDGSIGSPYQTLGKIFSQLVTQEPVSLPWSIGDPLKPKNSGGSIPTGSTIYLREGNYGLIDRGVLRRYHNAEVVTVKSYPGETATITQLNMESSSNWVFDGLRIDRSGLSSAQLVNIVSNYHGDSYNITIQNCTLIGESNIDSWGVYEWRENTSTGIKVQVTKNLVLLNNTIKNIDKPIVAYCSDSLFKNNTIEYFVRDGMNPLGDNNSIMYNKVINRIPSSDGNHDDMLQITANSGIPIVGILLYKNLFIGDYNRAESTSPYIQGLNGGSGQGIGCFDGAYDSWVVANNVVSTSSHIHGISIYDARNSIITNNIVLRNSNYVGDGNVPGIRLQTKQDDIPDMPITNNIVKNNVVAGSISVPNTNYYNYKIGNIVKDNYSGFGDALDPSIFQDYSNFDLTLTPEAVSTIGFDINDSVDVAGVLEEQKMKLVSGRGLEFNGVDQYIELNGYVNQLIYFKDGVFTVDVIDSVLSGYQFGLDNGGNGILISGVVNTFIASPIEFDAATLEQIRLNPEKAFYLDNGILKSDILDQSTLDDMEVGNGFAYLMTENENCNGNLTNICTGTTTAVSGWSSTMHTNVADHSRGIQTALLSLDYKGAPTGLASIDVQEFNFIDTKASLENNGLELLDSTGTWELGIWELAKINPVYLFDGTVSNDQYEGQYEDWFGGSEYYQQWSNGVQFDNNTFPVAVWLQSPDNIQEYKDIGINLFIGLWDGPTESQLQTLKSEEMIVIAEQNETGLNSINNDIIKGWSHIDEPDNAQWNSETQTYDACISPTILQEKYNELKTLDSTRPVYLNFGKGLANETWSGRGVCTGNNDEYYPEASKAADILSFDIYPVTSTDENDSGNLWYVAQGVERLRNYSNNSKPVWVWIETTHVNNPDVRPTPSQIRSEVWLALIHGANGIGYFAHEFQPSFKEAGLLYYQEISAAVKDINAQVQSFAPLLNSPSIENGISVSSTNPNVSIATMLKRTSEATFVFAVSMREESTSGEFILTNLPENAKVEVVDENRYLKLNEDKGFSDEFGAYEVHIYKINH
jgi:hypothetical protein